MKITKAYLRKLIMEAIEDHPYESDYSGVYMVVAYDDLGRIETLKDHEQQDQIYDTDKEADQAAINATAKSSPSKIWVSKSVKDLLRMLPRKLPNHGRIKQLAQTHLDQKTLPESAGRGTYRFVMYDKKGNEKKINVYDAPDEEHARKVAAASFAAKSHGWTFDPPGSS